MNTPGNEAATPGLRWWRPVALALLGATAPGWLAGCSILGGSKEPLTIYAPEPQLAADPSWPDVPWQLTVGQPDAARMVDSLRIVVRPTPGELQVYKGVSWAQSPGDQIQDAVLHVLEDSKKIAAVARKGNGIAADYTLLMDVRRYEADYAGAAVPAATIEVNAKLLHALDRDIVASHTFVQSVPAPGTDTASVARAFGTALGGIGHDIAGWTLEQGDAHERGVHAKDTAGAIPRGSAGTSG